MTLKKTIVLTALLLVAALPALAQVDTGSADFSRYVAFGDSLTAGFASNGLALDSQATSYPILVYAQVNGGAAGFEQPLISDPGIPAQLHLASLVPLSIVPKAGSGVPVNLTLPRPYDNMAVPGADVNDFLNTVTDGGGMHDLILRGLGTQMLQGLSLQPTFVTLWIGSNDALGAAVSGIVIDGVTLTRAADFEARFRQAASTIAGSGAQMAIATLVDVTSIPYVRALPPVVLDPTTRQPVLIGGQPVPLIGPDGVLSSNDFVLLHAQAEMAAGFGIPVALGGNGQPLSDSSVLSANEAATISGRIEQFNSVIRAVANETGAALVDLNVILAEWAADGVNLGGVDFTADFVTGGLFSYDGVHGSKLGYALVANEFVRAINRHYGGSIPLVNLRPFAYGETLAGFPAAALGNLQLQPTFGDQVLRSLGYPTRQRLEQIKRVRGGSAPTPVGPSGPGPRRPRPHQQ